MAWFGQVAAGPVGVMVNGQQQQMDQAAQRVGGQPLV
jgi:hypothetical protein